MPTIYCIRHAESAANAGLATLTPMQTQLTEKGRLQAMKLAKELEREPNLIVHSRYNRTYETALPTIKKFPRAKVLVWPVEEFTFLEPSRWPNGSTTAQRAPVREAFWKKADPMYKDGPGAESFAELFARVKLTMENIGNLPKGAMVYLFSHGMFLLLLRKMMRETLTQPSSELMKELLAADGKDPIRNAEGYVVKMDNGKCVVGEKIGGAYKE